MDEAKRQSDSGRGRRRPGVPCRDERCNARLQGDRFPRGEAEEPREVGLQGGAFLGPPGLLTIRKGRPRTSSVLEYQSDNGEVPTEGSLHQGRGGEDEAASVVAFAAPRFHHVARCSKA